MIKVVKSFNSDSPFPHVLVYGTGLAILSLASVYISSSLVLH
jgi:hypothetical protein